jgi:prefoldin subunit 5
MNNTNLEKICDECDWYKEQIVRLEEENDKLASELCKLEKAFNALEKENRWLLSD